MKPILFPSTATTFTSQGLGVLSDCISCVVREERNGEYELTMEYPVGGIHYDEIADRAIIYAIPSPYRTPQPFRIYLSESPINGVVTFHAHHISYDLSGIPVEPFTASTCADALDGLVSNSVVTNPFTVDTDKLVTGTYKLSVPTSFRSCLGGEQNSILDVYGTGEYEFDKYSVYLHLHRGTDNGVKIAYGKNLTDFNMERNLESIITGVYPYWSNIDENTLVTLTNKVIPIYDVNNPAYLLDSGGNYLLDSDGKYLLVMNPFPFDNILPLDLSLEFEEQPTQEELKAKAEEYIRNNNLGVPKVSINVSFVDLASTEEYKDLAVLEEVDLCDTVTVEFPLYGISVKAKIVSIETDCLLEKYNEVTIGNYRYTIADTLANLTLNQVTKEEVKIGNQKSADYINNTKGTFEFLDNGDGTNGGFTIFENGTDSWLRCTAGGIGISPDGGMTYTNAITKNGIVASQVDVQNNGNTLFYAGYDSEIEGNRITAYTSDFSGKLFEISTGKWSVSGEPQSNSWKNNLVLRDPENDANRIVLTTGKVNLGGAVTYTNSISVYSPTDSNEKTASVNISANTSGNAGNAWSTVGVTAVDKGYIGLYANANPNATVSPSIQVLDSTVDTLNHYLKLIKITINGTQYYMLASTN